MSCHQWEPLRFLLSSYYFLYANVRLGLLHQLLETYIMFGKKYFSRFICFSVFTGSHVVYFFFNLLGNKVATHQLQSTSAAGIQCLLSLYRDDHFIRTYFSRHNQVHRNLYSCLFVCFRQHEGSWWLSQFSEASQSSPLTMAGSVCTDSSQWTTGQLRSFMGWKYD